MLRLLVVPSFLPAMALAVNGCNSVLDIPSPEGRGGAEGLGSEAPECAQHADCLTDGADTSQRICRRGTCVPFLTRQCPIALPSRDKLWLQYLKADGPEPLVLGVLSQVLTASLVSTDALNYDLALGELADATGGLPVAGTRPRPVVALVCDNQYTQIEQFDRVIDHLVDDIEVPGVIATLGTDDFRYAFERSTHKHVFYLNVFDASPELLARPDYGLTWHMLPGYEAFVVPYVRLLERTIRHLRARGTLAPDEPVKVAMVHSAYPPQYAYLAQRLIQELNVNGKSPAANAPAHFLPVRLEPDDAAGESEYSAAIEELRTFSPDVVIAIAGDEFLLSIVPALEVKGEDFEPFYLLSPSHALSAALHFDLGKRPDLAKRIAGVNFAAAETRAAYDAYRARFAVYHRAFSGESTGLENFYDGAYYLLYAAAAAPPLWPLEGTDLAIGMRRLLSGAESFEVGPADLDAAFHSLARAQNTITLNGTMGPPDFDPHTGERMTPGTVWCVFAGGEVSFDVLRLNAAQELTGDFPCFEFEP